MKEVQSTPATLEESVPQSQRRALLAGAGLIAALGGAGFAWWRSQAAPAVANEAALPEGFWAMQWDTPQGGALRMQDLRGKPLLLNFWATWCPPCIEELPLINEFFQKNKANGWTVIGLAIDRPSAVQGFLQKLPLDFPVGLAAATGSELARQLGNPSGSLPFSIALDAQGSVAQRKLGRLHPEDLAVWAQLK
jgi:thiol-disulfide isomerase/thioredoxin